MDTRQKGGLLRPKRAFLLGVGAALLLGACRTTTVATQNLDAVLSSTDSFRYNAATTGVWEDLFSNSLASLKSLTRGKPPAPKERGVPNPSRVALANLLRLADSDEGPEAWRHNEQVRTFARYATSAPSQLCRERAVLSLVPHAKRLGITEGAVRYHLKRRAQGKTDGRSKTSLLEQLQLVEVVDHWWQDQLERLPSGRAPNVHQLWSYLVDDYDYDGSYKSVR